MVAIDQYKIIDTPQSIINSYRFSFFVNTAFLWNTVQYDVVALSAPEFRQALHCKMRSMKVIQNYHNEHTKFNFGMLIVVILYELHTSHFAVYTQFSVMFNFSFCDFL